MIIETARLLSTLLFCPSLLILIDFVSSPKHRAFSVVQHHIYSESSYQEQSLKKTKIDMSCVY